MNAMERQEAPRYVTLRDYLRVVRRYLVLIAVITIACGAAAYALTAREKAVYRAQASLFVHEPTQSAPLEGVGAIPPEFTDATRAQFVAQTITQPSVLRRVKADLHSPLPLGALAGPIAANVDAQTTAVVIQAASADRRYAQLLANGFAKATKEVYRGQARAYFNALANSASALARKSAFTRRVYPYRIATLQFLAATADPVQIIQPAALPVAPSGPPTVRNTLLGVLLGLVIALLVAFGRDALDRRLRRPSEVGDQLGWPIVGHIRESAFRAPVFSSRNGKLPGDEGDRESFRILRQNLRFLDGDTPPGSILVTSALPQEGKSTVAATLAWSFAAAGVQTLLVECDLRRPSLADRFGLAKMPGLTDFLLGEAAPPEILQLVTPPAPMSANGHGPAAPTDGGENGLVRASATSRQLVCITAGRTAPEAGELLASQRFKGFLREVAGVYEQVILDAGPMLPVADTKPLVPEAAATLVCVRVGRTTHEQVAAVKEAIERLPHRLLGVVVTGVPRASEVSGYYGYATPVKAER